MPKLRPDSQLLGKLRKKDGEIMLDVSLAKTPRSSAAWSGVSFVKKQGSRYDKDLLFRKMDDLEYELDLVARVIKKEARRKRESYLNNQIKSRGAHPKENQFLTPCGRQFQPQSRSNALCPCEHSCSAQKQPDHGPRQWTTQETPQNPCSRQNQSLNPLNQPCKPQAIPNQVEPQNNFDQDCLEQARQNQSLSHQKSQTSSNPKCQEPENNFDQDNLEQDRRNRSMKAECEPQTSDQDCQVESPNNFNGGSGKIENQAIPCEDDLQDPQDVECDETKVEGCTDVEECSENSESESENERKQRKTSKGKYKEDIKTVRREKVEKDGEHVIITTTKKEHYHSNPNKQVKVVKTTEKHSMASGGGFTVKKTEKIVKGGKHNSTVTTKRETIKELPPEVSQKSYDECQARSHRAASTRSVEDCHGRKMDVKTDTQLKEQKNKTVTKTTTEMKDREYRGNVFYEKVTKIKVDPVDYRTNK